MQGGVFWVESEACYGYVVRRGEAGARNRMSCKGYATAAEAEAARRGVLQAAQAAELNQPRHSARRGLYPSGFRAWQPAQMVERELQRQMLERREPAGSLFHAFVSQVMVHDFEAVPAHLLHLENWTPVEALLESLRKYHADAAAVTVRRAAGAHSTQVCGALVLSIPPVRRLGEAVGGSGGGAKACLRGSPFQPRCP